MSAPHRPIRSFVLRAGRISRAQKRALETLLPVYGIPFRPEPLDLDQVFGRAAARILEIGFGMGETTATIAAEHPETDFIGVEVPPRASAACSRKSRRAGSPTCASSPTMPSRCSPT